MNDYPSIAAVDLGSNSFHLVVAREVDGSLQILHKEKQRVYLADGLDDKNHLSQAAIERALAILKQFAATLQDFPLENVKVAATYTLRRAKNIHSFLTQASDVFPYPIEVISGQEEARLIYQGVAHYIHHDNNRLVIDIGGGSTELIIGKHFKHRLLSSRNMGCVSYTKQFFADGQINAKRFAKAQIRAEQELEVIFANYINTGWQSVVGTSGTIKSILAMINANDAEQELITLERLHELKTQFIAAKQIQNLHIEGLTPERQESICGGLAILIALFTLFDIDAMQYSDFSLREGLLHEMQQKLAHKDIRTNTIHNLSDRNTIDKEHANRVSSTAEWLFEHVKTPWQLSHPDFLNLLNWAAQLHEIGLGINSSGLHKHSAYIVANSQLPGFTQQQQTLLSCMIRFYRKKIRLDQFPTLHTVQHHQILQLIVILRLAVLLNQKRTPDQGVSLTVTAKQNSMFLKFNDTWLKEHTLLLADLQQEQKYLKKVGFLLDFH
ncbi:exopolyphosphatase [Pseudoalteromonas lipolytica]|jgi:exopolyphosphatase/guanosine-5'-triphosphate,3'-diphosphate pyrophosphatase|uniref:Exopolyphosphatase n=1 Tax=Pseudoalteromonas lipolytica TaxID=570156 RepID=A0AAD0S2A0_9GAMM|nr:MULTISPECIES: exopolyphosphatase [Pseudoalteromonas]AXV66522.1 exopolyphosphatase [Pseudoalteromonas donghaensis]EWH04647.1 phosphatase [Pseudoalteromonas lipolytica SCSIO 04301]QLJ08046.1 exopolyphosphatase [Pseudoalteromonas sp. JSTW]